jgi:hypothetical protein
VDLAAQIFKKEKVRTKSWMSEQCLELVLVKRRLVEVHNNSLELLREYKLVCKKVKKEVQKCKKRWNDNLMSKLESDRRKSDYRSIYKTIDKMSTPEYKASFVAIRKKTFIVNLLTMRKKFLICGNPTLIIF